MEMKLEQILEALLLSASRPLSINEILAAFDKGKSPSKDVKTGTTKPSQGQ